MVYPYFKRRELRAKERFFDNQRIHFESLLFGIASPDQIRSWAQRTLPNGSVVGEVTNWKTVDYKTLKPLRGGLFCQRTFGPIEDFQCQCGKGPVIEEGRPTLWFCPKCEVEFQPASIRRHRMGYVELGSGCVHLWYYKGRPNYLSILLVKKPNFLKSIVYATTVLAQAHELDLLPPDLRSMTQPVPVDQSYRPNQTIPIKADFFSDMSGHGDLYSYMCSIPEDADIPIPDYCLGSDMPSSVDVPPERSEEEMGQMSFEDFLDEYKLRDTSHVSSIVNKLGGQAIIRMINQMDLPLTLKVLALDLRKINYRIQAFATIIRIPLEDRQFRKMKQRRLAMIRRYKLINTFLRNQRDPAWMVLSVIPVLPPTLRPIVLMENGTTTASDVNRLYQRVVFRSKRLQNLPLFDTNLIGFVHRMLQESVESLFENGKAGNIPVMGNNNRPLSAIADRLKGKRGRFRMNLLGKRMDYSARSVIVVGPKMSLHECGLPREIALRLFLPFLLRRLISYEYVKTFKRANDYVRYQNPLVWTLLSEMLPHFPVLLNRAPTLHRLGIQAFQPRIVSSHAISLHPLVCAGFNADFDGDQMAVHMPFSFHARAEAWKLLWSRNNLLAPATGDPILAPSQDMILGSYYLTKTRDIDPPYPPQFPEMPTSLTPELQAASSEETFELELLETKSAGSFYFSDVHDATYAFYQDVIKIRTPIWLRLSRGQTSQSGEGAQSPIELQIQADGFGFAVFDGLQQHRHWAISTQESDFLTAYALILAQYVQTTVGRVLVNQLILSHDRPTSESILSWIQKGMEKLKQEIQADRTDEDISFAMKKFVQEQDYERYKRELGTKFFNSLPEKDKKLEARYNRWKKADLKQGAIERKKVGRELQLAISQMLEDYEASAKVLFNQQTKKTLNQELPTKELQRLVDGFRGFLTRRHHGLDMLTPQDIKLAKEIYYPLLNELFNRDDSPSQVQSDPQTSPDQDASPDQQVSFDQQAQSDPQVRLDAQAGPGQELASADPMDLDDQRPSQ